MWLVILLLFGILGIARCIILENSVIRIKLDDNNGKLLELTDLGSRINWANTSSTSALWSVSLVDENGESTISSTSNCLFTSDNKFKDDTVLKWACDRITFAISIHLDDISPISNWSISIDTGKSSDSVGVWAISLSIPVATSDPLNSFLFFGGGFGFLSTTNQSQSHTYPSGEASMQFMAVTGKNLGSGAYMSAMDPSASTKQMQYVAPPGGVMRFTVYPENEGTPLMHSRYTVPYSFGIGVVPSVSPDNGKPLWYEAALIYKRFAITADWTKAGPLRDRTDIPQPAWFRNTSIWLNTHWQCHNVFNVTGGEPSAVIQRLPALAKRLSQPINLHYYEFQQGPIPGEANRYRFDSHYPDYLPARPGFKEVVAQLQGQNVRVFPYTNGRIFDVNSVSYLGEQGNAYCSKSAEPTLIGPGTVLTSYFETYGNNVTFCVSNPFTPYWQGKVAAIVEALIKEYNVAGVYIDQIGSAVPKLCFDSTHGHSLGGGSFWRQGYKTMLQRIYASIGTAHPIVIEDNSEMALDFVSGMLTLTPYRSHFSQSTDYASILAFSGDQFSWDSNTNSRILSPAYQVVYGGYFVSFGIEWFVNDWIDHDFWCGKLASTFVTGSQLGWFSLVGMLDDPNDACGPMGVGDLLISPEHAPLTDFLVYLANLRSHAIILNFLADGYIARPLVLSPVPPALQQSMASKSPARPLLWYDSVVPQCWHSSADSNDVMCFLVGSTTTQISTTIRVQWSNWGFTNAAEVTRLVITPDGLEITEKKAELGSDNFLAVVVPPREAVIFIFRKASI